MPRLNSIIHGALRFLGIVVLAALFCAANHPLSMLQAQPAFSHFEARSTHPIGITPGHTRLLALNQADSRLSVFDISNGLNPEPILLAEIPVGLEPVSVKVRTEDEVWVVNEVSDSVSVVSLSLGVVIDTLNCADEPADVVFAQGKAFVSCSRNSLIRVYDAASRTELGTIPLQGQSPRALATDENGAKIYAVFQLSGNRTTILPAASAPPQPSPTNTNLPAPPKTALIIPADDPRIRYTVLDHDIAEMSATTHEVLRYLSDAGTCLFDAAIRPGTSELWVANTESLNLIRFEPKLKGHFADNRLTRLNLSDGSTQAFDLNPGVDYSLLPNPSALATSLAQPTAIAFTANGSNAWVAAFASDRVAKISALDGSVLGRVDVRTKPLDNSANDARRMRGPRGLVLDEAGGRLYVLNRLAATISTINLSTESVISEIPVGSRDPMPRAAREGRGFLFDARLSGNGTISCGTCHIDGDRDGLAWDLGDPNGAMVNVAGANLASHDTRIQQRPMHPMKGPMMTQTLRGLGTNQLLHWRGDRATIQDFNSTFRDLMGGSLVAPDDMTALAAYLATLRHHPNPNRNLDGSFPASLNGGDPARGRDLFTVHINHCSVCHELPTGSDNNVDDRRNFGGNQSLKTPSLQTVYQRALLDSRPGATNITGFGLTHDGTGGRQLLPTVHFYELDLLSGTGFTDVSAYVLTFATGTAPVVGHARTLTTQNRSALAMAGELQIMETQAGLAFGCDLVVRGRIGGSLRQFLYEASSQLYRPDRASEAGLSRDELLAGLGTNDFLTFLAVQPGAGSRLGRDRDGNGTPDGDETPPRLYSSEGPEGFQIAWPEAAKDWLLESSPSLGSHWQPDTHPRFHSTGQLQTIKPENEETPRFFRLRRTW